MEVTLATPLSGQLRSKYWPYATGAQVVGGTGQNEVMSNERSCLARSHEGWTALEVVAGRPVGVVPPLTLVAAVVVLCAVASCTYHTIPYKHRRCKAGRYQCLQCNAVQCGLAVFTKPEHC